MNKQGILVFVVVAVAGMAGLCGCDASSRVTMQPVVATGEGKRAVLIDVVVLNAHNDVLRPIFQNDGPEVLAEHLMTKPNPAVTEYILQAHIMTFDGEPATVSVSDKGGKRNAQCRVTPTILDDGSVQAALVVEIDDEIAAASVTIEKTQEVEPLPIINRLSLETTLALPAGKPILAGCHCYAKEPDNTPNDISHMVILVRAEIVATEN